MAKSNLGFSLAIIFAGSIFGCSQTQADCWEPLLDSYNALNHEFYRSNRDILKIDKAKLAVSNDLGQCVDGEEFLRLDPVLPNGPVKSISLLDLAVISNDGALTGKFYERMQFEMSRDRDAVGLANKSTLLHLAAFFESEKANEELLRLGAEPNATNEYGQISLHSASARTGSGLRIIKELVRSGADIDSKSDSGATPVMVGRLEGDLSKVQCLYSLSAEIPTKNDFEGRGYDPRIERDVVRVDKFLFSDEKELPKTITNTCSL